MDDDVTISLTDHLDVVETLDRRLDEWVERCYKAEREVSALKSEVYELRMRIRADSAHRAAAAEIVRESLVDARETRRGLSHSFDDIRDGGDTA